jgi:hypothetical protein
MHAEHDLYCSNCSDFRPSETPPCADGHGADCPDRACTDCGAALLVDPFITCEEPRPAPRRAA